LYRKILVPMDGSGFSEVSVEHAKALAIGCSAKEVVLMGVVEPIPDSAWVDPAERAEAAKKAEKWTTGYLATVAEGLRKDNVTVNIVIGKGDPASEILDYAKNDSEVDLIIMATHGDSGIVRWLVGSVSERVVLHSTVPVMSIPPGSR
jgi:nucleotide-binding universal stress UspA family protein